MSNDIFRKWFLHGKMPYKLLIDGRWQYPYLNEDLIKRIPTTADYLSHYDFTFLLEKNIDNLVKLVDEGRLRVTDFEDKSTHNKGANRSEE